MKITFLVGNGFDISCGLKVSYSSFYKWYLKQRKSEKEHINKFREEIAEDIAQGKENWSDFELGFGKYTSHFTINTVNDFIDCYEDAHQNLMKYLQTEEDKFDYSLDSEAVLNFEKGLMHFYSELSSEDYQTITEMLQKDKNGMHSINFISFNYTDVLDRILNSIADYPYSHVSFDEKNYECIINPEVLHVHGKIDYYPIFGVNDETQITQKELLSTSNFPILMIKPESANAAREEWRKKALHVISESQIICIFGMSIGETDAIWFSTVITWLKSNINRHLIIFWYTSNPSNDKLIWRRKQSEKEARNKILNFANPAERNAISNRIHVVENTKSVLQIELQKKTIATALKHVYNGFFYDGINP